MRDRDGEAFAGRPDDVAFEPVRAPFRMRRDDDLVRTEGAQRILHRLERVAVADLALGLDAITLELRQAGIEPALGGGACTVLVRSPRPHR